MIDQRRLGFMRCSWIQRCSRLSMTQSTVSACCALFTPHGVRWTGLLRVLGLRVVRHTLIQSTTFSVQSTAWSYCPIPSRVRSNPVDYLPPPVDYGGKSATFLLSFDDPVDWALYPVDWMAAVWRIFAWFLAFLYFCSNFAWFSPFLLNHHKN